MKRILAIAVLLCSMTLAFGQTTPQTTLPSGAVSVNSYLVPGTQKMWLGNGAKKYWEVAMSKYVDSLVNDLGGKYVSLTGSYSNPGGITSLAWSKITGAPSVDLSNYVDKTTNQTIEGTKTFTDDLKIGSSSNLIIGPQNDDFFGWLSVGTTEGLELFKKNEAGTGWTYRTSYGPYGVSFNRGPYVQSINGSFPSDGTITDNTSLRLPINKQGIIATVDQLDALQVGKANAGLTLSAGYGLLGGGNLTASRTFTVDTASTNGIASKAYVDTKVSGSGVVTLNTAQTITGQKTFSNSLSVQGMTVGVSASDPSSTIVGFEALMAPTTGNINTALGHRALKVNTTGSTNTAVGASTLGKNTTGYTNTAVGNSTMRDNVSGANNTALGHSALLTNVSGDFNTAIGNNALQGYTNGTRNTAIGAQADVTGSFIMNATSIGSQAVVTESNKVQLGNTSVTKLGVGTTTITGTDGTAKTFALPTATTGTVALTSDITTAVATKQNTLTLTTTGTGAATLVGSTLNIPTPEEGVTLNTPQTITGQKTFEQPLIFPGPDTDPVTVGPGVGLGQSSPTLFNILDANGDGLIIEPYTSSTSKLTGNLALTGTVSTAEPTLSSHSATKNYVDTKVSGLVSLDGTQTITGTKTFTGGLSVAGYGYISLLTGGGLQYFIGGSTENDLDIVDENGNGISLLGDGSVRFTGKANLQSGAIIPLGTTFTSPNQVVNKGYVDSVGVKRGVAAPTSATDTGVDGEIRVTATHIYICTATNTWVRAALATW